MKETDLPPTPPAGAQPGSPLKSRLDYFWRYYLSRHKGTLLLAVLAGAIAAVASGFGYPFIIKSLFPVIFDHKDLPSWLHDLVTHYTGTDNLAYKVVMISAFGLPFMVIVSGIATFFNNYLLNSAGLKVLEKLRLQIYSKYQHLPLSYHESQKRGDLLSRLMHDTQFLQEGIISVANDFIVQPLTLAGAMGYIIYVSTQTDDFFIFLSNVLIVAICVIPVQRISRKMLHKARQAQAGLGDITATLQENLASQRDIRAFEMEQQQISTLRFQIKNFFKTMLNVVKWQSALAPIIEMTSAIALSIILFLGSRKGMSTEDFAALAVALYLCYEAVKRLGAIHNRLSIVTAGLERINAVIYAHDDMPDPEHPVEFSKCTGNIRFDHVSFGYNPQKPVIHDISLEIPAGQMVALVGPSGAGKTTFANLVCRFYDPTSGTVMVDGTDIRDIRKKDLLNQIALVSQFPVLFRGTIAENIRIGRPGATDDEVAEAARQAAVDSFCVKGDGYNRFIGESGDGLSGGQKQRVSIARAFLKNAPILILDEATASLDMKSEELIQHEIEKLSQNRTSLIIAHRFSTIRNADRILLFEQGKIAGDGTHDELYRESPLYRDLYDKQIMK